MKVQLEKVAAQIKDYIESLSYNGLNLVSIDNIKQLEFFLQNASQSEAYRLATSLRYLHVELKRFLTNRSAFNIERYVFFLNNSWLLSRMLSLKKRLKEERKDLFDKLMGAQLNPEIESKLILRIVGTEKVNLEGTMVGFVFYFISIFGKTRGKILKWNLMHSYKSGILPEALLHLDIPNSEPSRVIETILMRYIEAENIPYITRDNIIFLEKNPASKVYIDEDSSEDNYVSISKLDKFYLNSEDIYKRISKNYEVTPFDLPKSFLDYYYVKNVKFEHAYIRGDEETKGKTLTHVYEITHEKDYPLFINIPDKQGNLKLIEEFDKLKKKKKPIEAIFCKLFLERGQLSLYPLGIIKGDQILFPNMLKSAPRNRDLLKTLYKVK